MHLLQLLPLLPHPQAYQLHLIQELSMILDCKYKREYNQLILSICCSQLETLELADKIGVSYQWLALALEKVD